MDSEIIRLAVSGVAVLGCIGLLFGIGLALAAHRFAVKSNPRVEEVLEVLAGAQCGGCGYAGCEAYAEAVIHDPEVKPNLCFPGKSEVARLVASISGKEAAAVEDVIARVRCSRVEGHVAHRHTYLGIESCAAAVLAFGGQEACGWSCLGFGDCRDACLFNAIEIVNGFPEVDPDTCVGCGACVRACARGLFEIVPRAARVWIPCSTRDPGKKAKSVCEAGCISCNICVRQCPAKAIAFEDDRIRIDYAACAAFGAACGEICIDKCPRKIIRRPAEAAVAAN